MKGVSASSDNWLEPGSSHCQKFEKPSDRRGECFEAIC